MAKLRLYTGNSMKPLFREGDRLLTRRIAFQEIRRGDVICFFSPVSELEVVHRVIARRADGVLTRGDHNGLPDPWPVREQQAPRLVIGIRRGGHRLTVANGWRGRLRGGRDRLIRYWLRVLTFPFRRLFKLHLNTYAALSCHHFRYDDILFAGRRPVARRRRGGHWQLLAGTGFRHYQAAELERRFPPGRDGMGE